MSISAAEEDAAGRESLVNLLDPSERNIVKIAIPDAAAGKTQADTRRTFRHHKTVGIPLPAVVFDRYLRASPVCRMSR